MEIKGFRFKFNKQEEKYELYHCENIKLKKCPSLVKVWRDNRQQEELRPHSQACVKANKNSQLCKGLSGNLREIESVTSCSTNQTIEVENKFLKEKIVMMEKLMKEKEIAELKNDVVQMKENMKMKEFALITLEDKVKKLDSLVVELSTKLESKKMECSDLKKRVDSSAAFSDEISIIEGQNSSQNESLSRCNFSLFKKAKSDSSFRNMSSTKSFSSIKTKFGEFSLSHSKEWGKGVGRFFMEKFIENIKTPFSHLFFEFKIGLDARGEYLKNLKNPVKVDLLGRKARRFEVLYKYKNPFKTNEIYTCPDCKANILGKNFHRHIDECRLSRFDKDWCPECRRDCILVLQDDKTQSISHKHKCSRPIKFRRNAKIESIKRRHRRQGLLEKKTGKRKQILWRPRTEAEWRYIQTIIDQFVNEKRYKRIEFVENLKKGYPEEFLSMYHSDNYYSDFRRMFSCYIGEFGRFLGDVSVDKVSFTPEKAKELRKKYEKVFAYLDGNTDEGRMEIQQNGKKAARKFLEVNPIPDHRKVMIQDDMFNTYLLACGQRRLIDFEMGIANKKGKKLKYNLS
jgi:hypothetical protein